MDTLSPTPSPTLLSAQEATERLREIVEGFFFRRLIGEDGKPVRRLLVKSPPGLGKTKEAMDWATRYQTEQAAKKSILDLFLGDLTGGGVRAQVAIFVPRHELACEVKTVIERNLKALGRPITVPILRGRDQGAEEGKAPCRRWREARELGRKGLPVYSNICRRTHEAEVSECPHFANCEYIRAWRGAYAAPFVILVHSHLGMGWESASLLRRGGSFSLDDEHKRLPLSERSFNPADAAIVVCDEDPTLSLIESTRLDRGALQVITDLGELISEGLDAPSGLLSYLREKGVSSEQVRATAETLEHEERKRGQVTSPSASDKALSKEATQARPLVRLSRVLDRLADELASGRSGSAYSLVVNGNGLLAQGRRAWSFHERRLLVLDGTAKPEILRQFVPSLEAAPEIRVERNARVIQVTDRTFWKGSLLVSALEPEGKPGPTDRLQEVGDFIERTARAAKTLVVTNKPVRCALTGEGEHNSLPISVKYRGADVAHFGNLRGSNEFEEHDTVIILGRDEPSVRDAERRAMAIWYDAKEPICCIPEVKGHVNYPQRARAYLMQDGSRKYAKVSVHPDPRVQAVVEQGREAEMLQAIDRLRLIHTKKRKTVYILCSIPLDIPVDELVTWKQLTGDRRLGDALAECDARGWDALPLAPKELTRLFPGLWETKKAAERWTAKNPPKAYRDIIRVWGVLNTYRPKGQTSWSKALVRHGADAGMALADVLGLPTGDIRVRDRADQQPRLASPRAGC